MQKVKQVMVLVFLQISHKFFKKACKQRALISGEEREYGVGMFFFPQDEIKRASGKENV